MPSLLLHVGTEKTGSTAIQHLLSINQQKLLSMGYYVPSFLCPRGKNNHYILAMLCYDQKRDDHLTRMHPLFRQNHSLFVQSYMSLLFAALREFKNHVWLISSEFIQSRLTTHSELLRLRKLIESNFDKYQILSYHRHPLDLSMSLWSTSLKFGNQQYSPPTPDDKYFDNIANPLNIFIHFNSVFHGNALTFKIYESSLEASGSIIVDYLESFSLPINSLSLHVKSKNLSITAKGIRALIVFNKLCSESRFRSVARVRTGFSKLILLFFNRGLKLSPSPSLFALMSDHYRDDMQKFLSAINFSYYDWQPRASPFSPVTSPRVLSPLEYLFLYFISCASFAILSLIYILFAILCVNKR